jgi:hypothetical protein
MGMSVKPETARRILALLNRGVGTSKLSVEPRLQDVPPSSGLALEWRQFVYDATYIRVYSGPIYWADQLISEEPASGYYDVDYSGLSTNDERWLYVNIELLGAGITVALSASSAIPVSDPPNAIVRWRLSKWKKTATGIERLRTSWAGGCIQFDALMGPPIS